MMMEEDEEEKKEEEEEEEEGYLLCLLLYATATVFQLYHGSDMMYERRRKPDPTLLPTEGIFNLPHQIGMA